MKTQDGPNNALDVKHLKGNAFSNTLPTTTDAYEVCKKSLNSFRHFSNDLPEDCPLLSDLVQQDPRVITIKSGNRKIQLISACEMTEAYK